MKKTLISIGLAIATTAGVHAQLLNETFSYGDGSLVGATGSPWVTNFSGGAGEQNVTSGSLFLDDNETEDTKAWLLPFVSSGVISATFELTMVSAGAANISAEDKYFTHFVGNDTLAGVGLESIGRVFTYKDTGSSTDTILGLSNSSSTASVLFATKLALNQAYTLTLSYDFATVTSTLTIDGIGSIVATDTAATIARIEGYGFQQQSLTGDLFIDNLTIVPEPKSAALILAICALSAVGMRRQRNR
ncbi:MAG: hypothetical protein ACSHX4_11645 [Opitutaceae bacterium]